MAKNSTFIGPWGQGEKKKGPSVEVGPRPGGEESTRVGSLHLAGGRRAGDEGVVVFDRHEGVAGVLAVERGLAARLLPARHVEALLQLVVRLAHHDVAVE